MIWLNEAGETFVPSAKDRADLIAAGWRSPMQPTKPTAHRIRLVLWSRFARPRIDYEHVDRGGHPVLGTALVTLTEGVFDAEWPR